MDPLHVALVFAVLCLLVAVAYLGLRLLQLRWRATEDTLKRKARAVTARLGEEDAVALLAAAGYEIEALQLSTHALIAVDGEERRCSIKPDMIVRKDGARYVADVKTGGKAPSISHGPTRRQLLEYKQVFRAAGALLVDMEAQRIHRIEFLNYDLPAELVAKPDRISLLKAAGVGFALGIALALLLPA